MSKQQKDKQPAPLEGEVEPPAKRSLIRHPLDTLNGIIAEATRVYRQVRDGKLDHAEGRSARLDARADAGHGRDAGSGATGAASRGTGAIIIGGKRPWPPEPK